MIQVRIMEIKTKIEETIRSLSDPFSYSQVYHQPRYEEPMPSIDALKEMVDILREIIFPGYFGLSSIKPDTMQYYIGENTDKVYRLLTQQIKRGLCFVCTATEVEVKTSCDTCKDKSEIIAADFISRLTRIRHLLSTDVEATYIGDPAAKGFGEVIYCYPVIRALTNYRIAHELLKPEVPLIPRIITEMAHSETGIDIHPCAEIGEYFTIDHGTGVVIGETCIIGKNVKLYQGVTLGAKSFPLDENGNPIKGIKRHPIVEDNVIIYAEATILGRVTIGANSIIGGNV